MMMSCPPVPRTIRPLFFSVIPGDGRGQAIDGQERAPNGDFAREDDVPADVEDHGAVALRERVAKAPGAGVLEIGDVVDRLSRAARRRRTESFVGRGCGSARQPPDGSSPARRPGASSAARPAKDRKLRDRIFTDASPAVGSLARSRSISAATGRAPLAPSNRLVGPIALAGEPRANDGRVAFRKVACQNGARRMLTGLGLAPAPRRTSMAYRTQSFRLDVGGGWRAEFIVSRPRRMHSGVFPTASSARAQASWSRGRSVPRRWNAKPSSGRDAGRGGGAGGGH